jgi:hypothetical protein
MGVRLYNPLTGQFTSLDPVPGGNSTAYAYPTDPTNNFDLDGRMRDEGGDGFLHDLQRSPMLRRKYHVEFGRHDVKGKCKRWWGSSMHSVASFFGARGTLEGGFLALRGHPIKGAKRWLSEDGLSTMTEQDLKYYARKHGKKAMAKLVAHAFSAPVTAVGTAGDYLIPACVCD